MSEIKYKLTFYSYWHCGSGLGAGSDVDALVIRNEQGLPFVPGKTIKGLIHEAAADITGFRNNDPQIVDAAFGTEGDKQGYLFFTNAQLEDNEAQAILQQGLASYLYKDVSRTAIDDEGIAKDHSLRRIEVVVPCTLYGKIMFVEDEIKLLLCDALRYVKRLGVNRNRGLGRCKFEIVEE